MESEIAEYPPFLRVFNNGRIERLVGTDTVPASLDPQNGVVSKDVVFSSEHNLSVRLFLPRESIELAGKKLPLLVYFHGGAFIVESPFSPTYHNFLSTVVAAAECVAVSVEYRLAPEHPIPAAYDDSWNALKWVFAQIAGSGPEVWLKEHADFGKVYLAGDSAGANIAHHMAMKSGEEKIIRDGRGDEYTGIQGLILIHPCFWGKNPIDEQDVKDEAIRSGVEAIWALANPNSTDGVNDGWINVVQSGSNLTGLGCNQVLVTIAGKDIFVRQGWAYAAKLKKSGWRGDVEVVEDIDEEHVFHLKNPNCEKALKLTKKFAEFINGKM